MPTELYKLFIVFTFSIPSCNGRTAEEWKGRIIYQLLTDRFAPSGEVPSHKCTNLRDYCGGTFRGIEKRLDYITGLGVNAIWISPIVLNTDKGYHGYWAKDIFEINPHFGTKEDLKSLIRACQDRDVWVMVDLVANHMGYPPDTEWNEPSNTEWNNPSNTELNDPPNNAWIKEGVKTRMLRRFDQFVPFNDSKYFHPAHPYIQWPQECKEQWKIEIYWLAGLPDINQTNPFVRQTFLKWIQGLTSEYGFDGYRLDTVIQVPKTFWQEFQLAGEAFMLGEANNGPPPCGSIDYVSGYQGCIDSVLDYPMYWTLRKIFQEKTQSFTSLSIAIEKSYEVYKERSVLGGFVDNHDNPRFLNLNPNRTGLMNELAFVLMADWIPIVYYGTEQAFNGGSDPNNRESLWPYMSTTNALYKFIQTLVRFRKSLGNDWLQQKQVERHVQPDVYAFSRRDILVVVTSQDATVHLTLQDHPYQPGNTVRNILNDQETFKKAGQGKPSIGWQKSKNQYPSFLVHK